MKSNFDNTRIGLALVMAGLLFGILLGMGFGIAEDSFKDFISEGIAAHPTLHDTNSQSKIWRYGQRAHFHATGIAAFSLGLIVLVILSNMQDRMKNITSSLIGLSSFYPLAWFNMYLMAPTIGRDPAHHHLLTKTFIYIGIGGLLTGILLLMLHIFAGKFHRVNQ
jgi:hypothetical protein